MKGGPVETAFTVYQDFFAYKSGIYVHTSGGVAGGHAVKIIGWGNQAGTNYWIVANSWGASWGMSGFFWIEFGQCGIDTDAYAGDMLILPYWWVGAKLMNGASMVVPSG